MKSKKQIESKLIDLKKEKMKYNSKEQSKLKKLLCQIQLLEWVLDKQINSTFTL